MDDLLLTKYLLKEATGEEIAAVRRWIAANPENERRYAQLQRVWDASQRLARKSDVDEEAAWRRFVHRRDRGQTSNGMVRKLGWLRIAAILVLGSAAALVGYYSLSPDSDRLGGVTHRTADAVSVDTLADGSVITLSRHASLRFSQGLFGQKRMVELHGGEVFFEVAPDRDKPFVIRSGDVTVTVLGTSFHVKRKGDETTVMVESGKVKVEGLHRTVALTARQQVTINTKTQQFKAGRAAEILDRTPLWRIAELLEEAYGVEVTVARDEIRDLPMTTTLHSGTLDEKLRVIAESLGITVERQGNRITFK